MRRVLVIIGMLCVTASSGFAAIASRADAFSDGAGTEWLPLSSTEGLSAGAIVTVCPRDGVHPCSGTVGGHNLTGWVWATEAQVRVVLAARVSSSFATQNVAHGFGFGIAFIESFGLTGYFANTYSSSEWSYGWSSSVDGSGLPIGAGASWGFPPVSGGAGIGASADSAVDYGAFLWRADGSGGTAAMANDDSGTVDPPYAQVAVANALANDTLSGAQATVANVSVATVSASPGLSLDPADGSVDVAAGTQSGSKELVYRMCSRSSLTNCDTATVSVVVSGNLIKANADSGSARTSGEVAIGNVLANDTLGGLVATTANVVLAQLSASSGLGLDLADGSVDVAQGTADGAATLQYSICERAQPTNCDSASVAVQVNNLIVSAVDDAGTAPATRGGTAVANVLANDRIDGHPATLGNVSLALVSASAGVTLDLTDGSVDAAAGSGSGAHPLIYEICERAVATNCASATAVITVSPQAIVVSNYRPTVTEGNTGTVTVRLAQQPLSNVVVAAKFYAGTTNIAPAPLKLTFTAANWNTAQTLSLPAKHDSNQHDAAATINLTAPGLETKQLVVTVRDDDQPAGYPVATMASPLNGQTVSGTIAVSATAVDPGGAIDEVRYYVKATRIYKGASGGTAIFNTATLLNGWNLIEVRATDTLDNESRMQIKVLVQN